MAILNNYGNKPSQLATESAYTMPFSSSGFGSYGKSEGDRKATEYHIDINDPNKIIGIPLYGRGKDLKSYSKGESFTLNKKAFDMLKFYDKDFTTSTDGKQKIAIREHPSTRDIINAKDYDPSEYKLNFTENLEKFNNTYGTDFNEMSAGVLFDNSDLYAPTKLTDQEKFDQKNIQQQAKNKALAENPNKTKFKL